MISLVLCSVRYMYCYRNVWVQFIMQIILYSLHLLYKYRAHDDHVELKHSFIYMSLSLSHTHAHMTVLFNISLFSDLGSVSCF